MAKEYDVVIIGAGASGLTAGIYCGRAGLKTVVLEKTGVGGQVLKADVIENYPGFPDGVSGFELIEKIKRQAEKFGVEFVNEDVSEIGLRNQNHSFQVNTNRDMGYVAKAIIVATGATPKKLGIKGEVEFYGKGISYCATCDGPLFKNKEIIVIGGGDAAVGEAAYLTRFVKKVTLLHRRDSLRASKILQDRLLNNNKIEVKRDCIPIEILGVDRIEGVKVKDVKTNKQQEIPASGIFIYVGVEPNTGFLKGMVELDKEGFIITDEHMKTSINGIFACGDARKNTLKQIVTSCAEGAKAAYSCIHYIEELKD